MSQNVNFSGCTKAFSQLSNLQSHSRCHQTDKPYKCNSCYKCFSEESALLEHIPKHKDSKHVKTHICSYCGKSYTQETYLAKHMQKHSDRLDKRAPILAAASQPGSGLMADPYAWTKMDPMAMYGYGGAGLLGEAESRDIPTYSPPWPEPARTSSAFSPLQSLPPPASQTAKPTATQEFESQQFQRQTVQVIIQFMPSFCKHDSYATGRKYLHLLEVRLPYVLVCPSVGRSVGWSVDLSVIKGQKVTLRGRST